MDSNDQAAGPGSRLASDNPFPRTRSAPTRAVRLAMLNCAVLSCAVPCCAMLCCAILSCGNCQLASAAPLVVSGQSLAPSNSTLMALTFTNSSLQLGTVDVDLFDNLTPITVAN